MGYLLDNCLFDRLTSDIIDQCQPYSCEKDADIDSFVFVVFVGQSYYKKVKCGKI